MKVQQTPEERFGSLVKNWRVGAAMSQRALAANMAARNHPWVQSTVGKTEAADRPLRLNEFVGLCEVLGVSPLDALTAVTDSAPADEVDRELQDLAAAMTATSARVRDLEERARANRAEAEKASAEYTALAKRAEDLMQRRVSPS